MTFQSLFFVAQQALGQGGHVAVEHHGIGIGQRGRNVR